MSKSSIKILSVVALTAATLASAIGAFGVANVETIAPSFVNASRSDTLNSANAPTAATSWQYGINYTGIQYATYTFNRVKAYEGGLCTLNYNGTITKDEARGLQSITATFSGSLTVKTQFEQDGEEMYFDLRSGVPTSIYGNYITIHSNALTTIDSINIEYDCVTASSGMGDGVTFVDNVNGDDVERTYSNGVVSYLKSTYRYGSFTQVGTGEATFGLVEDPAGSGEKVYKFEAATASWSDVIDLEELKHTTKPASNANAWKHGIQYVVFDAYLESGSFFSLYSQTGGGDANKHVRDVFTAGGVIGDSNDHISVYDGDAITSRTDAGKWYRVVVDATNLATFGSDQYECVHLTYGKGSFYLSRPKLYHVNPKASYLSVNQSSYSLVNNASLINEFPALYGEKATSADLDVDVYENGAKTDDYVASVDSEEDVSIECGRIVAKALHVGNSAPTISFTKDETVLETEVKVDVVGTKIESDGSRLAVYTNGSDITHPGTYGAYGSEAGGRTGVYCATGSGTYKDQLDFPETARATTTNNSAEVMSLIRSSGVTHFALDICLAASSSARLQGNNNGSSQTNLLSVGSSYGPFNNGTFNSSISVYKNVEGELQKIEEGGEIIQADVWYTVLFDYSFAKTHVGTFSGQYSNASIVAPKGSVYIDNVRTLVA